MSAIYQLGFSFYGSEGLVDYYTVNTNFACPDISSRLVDEFQWNANIHHASWHY